MRDQDSYEMFAVDENECYTSKAGKLPWGFHCLQSQTTVAIYALITVLAITVMCCAGVAMARIHQINKEVQQLREELQTMNMTSRSATEQKDFSLIQELKDMHNTMENGINSQHASNMSFYFKQQQEINSQTRQELTDFRDTLATMNVSLQAITSSYFSQQQEQINSQMRQELKGLQDTLATMNRSLQAITSSLLSEQQEQINSQITQEQKDLQDTLATMNHSLQAITSSLSSEQQEQINSQMRQELKDLQDTLATMNCSLQAITSSLSSEQQEQINFQTQQELAKIRDALKQLEFSQLALNASLSSSQPQQELDSQIRQEMTNFQDRMDMLTVSQQAINMSLENTVRGIIQILDSIQQKLSACPSNWISFENSCYYASSREKSSWNNSRSFCILKNADLVVINSKEEEAFLESLVKDRSAWVGLSDHAEEGQWQWVDGTSYETTPKFWSMGQPDNWHNNKNLTEDCVHLYSYFNGVFWNDDFCLTLDHWICEKKRNSFVQIKDELVSHS